MSVAFDEYQRRKNEEFYKNREIEFKTFAADSRFARALAVDFHKRMKKEKVKVYEFGIGDGGLGVRFMLELRRLSENLAENTIYHFCDFSGKLVKNATKRADSFGFNVDGIVYDAVEKDPDFLVEPDYILMSEFYDDLPAKILVRDGKEVMELVMEEKGLRKFEGEDEIRRYMMGMPEGYHIPVNITAKKHLDFCISRIKGWIDVFDYGFRKKEITGMPAEMWNNSIIREFQGQITTDVNFDYLSKEETETQLEFVERVLGEKLHEVETDRLRYFNEEEIMEKGKELKKYGYEKDFHKDLKESRGYLHMRVG